MKISIYRPIEALSPYVHMIWVMEINEHIPDTDLKSIAPNGNPRIIIPIESESMVVKMHDVCMKPNINMGMIVGQQLTTAWVDCQGKNKVIGVELNPATAYKVLNTPMRLFTNTITDTSDIWGSEGNRLFEQLNDYTSLDIKIQILQQYLLKMLNSPVRQNKVAEYVTNTIIDDSGLTNIKELSKKMGYTQRHINNVFKEYIGITPKTFACVTRFNTFYKKLYNTQTGRSTMMDDVYDYYFDQTHFIKEFRRFTGYSPGLLQKKENSIGRLFSNI